MSVREDGTVDVDGPFTVISRTRPLTRQAERALEEYDIRDRITAGETDKGPRGVGDDTTVGVVVSDRPPRSVRDTQEVEIIEDPIEVWAEGTQQVMIYPDRVVGTEDGEMDISPADAAEFARDDDRFRPVDVPDDSPLDTGESLGTPASEAEGQPSFRIHSRDSRALKEVFDAVGRVVDAAVFRVGTERITIKAVDASNAWSVVTELRKEEFGLGYQVESGAIGVDMIELTDAVGEPNKSDPVILSTNDETGEIEVSSPDAGVERSVETMNPDELRDEPDIEGSVGGLNYQSAAEVPNDQFRRIVRATKKVSDRIALGISNRNGRSKFKTYGKGDIDEILGTPDHEFVGTGPEEEAGGLYTLSFIDPISLATPDVQEPIEIAFAGVDAPSRFTWETSGGIPNQVRYYVAPRIQSDSATGPTDVETLLDAEAGGTLIDQPDFYALADGERATRLFGYLETFADEYRMLVAAGGLETRLVDPSNTQLGLATASPAYFDSYRQLSGFPQDAIGVPGSRLLTYLKPWTQSQSFGLYADADTRSMEIEHPVFNIKMGTIDPDSIRQDPTLPSLSFSGTVTAPASAVGRTANDVFGGLSADGSADDDTPAIIISDSTLLFADSTGTSAAVSGSGSGEGFGIYSPDLILPVLDAVPKTGSVTTYLGFDFPVVFETEDSGLRTVSTVSPRILDDDNPGAPFVSILEERGLDASFLETGDTADRFDPFEGESSESLSERLKRKRLQNFPVEADVKKERFGDEYEVEESDDMAVAEETIEAVLEEVEAETENAKVGSGDVVAEVTFPSEDEYELEFRELEPDAPRRFSTEDGVQFRETSTSDGVLLYYSNRSETPSRYQIVLRAVEDGFKVGAKPPTEGPDEESETFIQQGMASLVDSVTAMIDYGESNRMVDIVEDAGVPVDKSTRDAREQFNSLFSPYVDFSITEDPVSSGEFYLGADGSGALTPDTTFNANISVPQPDIEDPFEVRYSISFTAKAPAAGEAAQIDQRRELASRTVGYAPSRGDVPRLVEEALDELADIDAVFARTDRGQPMPASDLPNPREGDEDSVTAHTDAFMPGGGDAIREKVKDAGLPLEFTEISGIGPARSETLQEAGVRDMVDYTALASTIKTVYWLSSIVRDLPDDPQDNIREAGGTIWARFVWPERSFPGDFDVGPDATEPDVDVQSLMDAGSEGAAPLPDNVESGRWDAVVVARPGEDFGERFEARTLPDADRKNPDLNLPEDALEDLADDTESDLQAWMYEDGDVVSAASFDEVARRGVRVAAQTFEPGETLLSDRTTDGNGNLTVTPDDGWVGIPPRALRNASEGDLQSGWSTSLVLEPEASGRGFGTVVGWDYPGYQKKVYNELTSFPYFVYNLDEETDQLEGLGIDGDPGKRHYVGLYRAPADDEIIGLEEGTDAGPKPPEPVFASEYDTEYELFPFFRSAESVESLIGETVLIRTSSGFVQEFEIEGEANNGAGVRAPEFALPDGKYYIPASSRHEDSTFEIIGKPPEDTDDGDDRDEEAEDEAAETVDALTRRLDVTTSVGEDVERAMGQTLPSTVDGAINALTNRVERGDSVAVPSLGVMEADELRDGVRRTQIDQDETPDTAEESGGDDTVREIEVKVRERSGGFGNRTLDTSYRLSLSPPIADDDPLDIAREIRSRVDDMPGTPARFMELNDPVAVAEVRGGDLVTTDIGIEEIVAPQELVDFEFKVSINDGAEATAARIADAFPAFTTPQAASVAEYVESVEDVLQFTPRALENIDGIADRTIGSVIGGDAGYRGTQTLGQQGVTIDSEPQEEPDDGPDMATPDQIQDTVASINQALATTDDILDDARDVGAMDRGRIGRLNQARRRLERQLEVVGDEPTVDEVQEAQEAVGELIERQDDAREVIEEERDDKLSRGEMETIVENATAGVDATAVIIQDRDELQRIRMVPDGTVPIDAENQITARAQDTREETVLSAIDRWETFADVSATDVSSINAARDALNDQFGLDIPSLDAESVPDETDADASRADEIDRRVREAVEEVLREAGFPETDPPATFSREEGLFVARPDVGDAWSSLLDSRPTVLRGEPGQAVTEFAEDYARAIYDMSTDQVQSQVDSSLLGSEDDQVETGEPETIETTPGETQRMFRTDLEEPFSEMLDIALQQDIPKEERGEEMAALLEESGLFQSQVPGKFTDAVIGLDFPMGGVGGGRDFAENVNVEIGGALGESPKSDMSVPGFMTIFTVNRPLIEIDDAWSDFVDLVKIADPDMDGFDRVSEKLDSIMSVSSFAISEGRVNWSESFMETEEIGVIASRSGEYWGNILEDMKATSRAWWAAQRVKEVIDGGNRQLRNLLEEELKQNPGRGTANWYLKNAWEIYLDYDEFDPVQYVQDWHDVFNPGESKSDAQRRRGEVDLDDLRRRAGDAPEPVPDPEPEPEPEPVTETEPDPDPDPIADPDPTRETGRSDSGEKTVDDLKDDILDRM